MKLLEPTLSSTVVLTLLAVALPLHVLGARPYVFEFDSYKHVFNTDYIKVFTVKLLKTKSDDIFNGSYIPNIDLEDFSFRVKISEISKLRSKPWTLLDVKLNVCDIIVTATKVNLIAPIIKNIQQHTRLLPDKCPFKKDKEYYLKNFSFDPEMFPTFMPTMKLKYMLSLEKEGVTFYEGTVMSNIVKKYLSNTKNRGNGVGGK